MQGPECSMEEAGCPMEESKLVEQILLFEEDKVIKYSNRWYGATNSKISIHGFLQKQQKTLNNIDLLIFFR